MINMKIYEEPNLELIDWAKEDVITLSTGEGDGDTRPLNETDTYNFGR